MLRLLAGCAVLLAVAGCSAATGTAAGHPAEASTAVPADELTLRLAQVEAARLCAVGTQTFADEADITTDLDTRLAAVGLTHAQWKDWHDALVSSPQLVDQLAEVSEPGCA